MAKPKLTRALCYQAGQDAANQQMRKENRTKWNISDWDLASGTTNNLLHFVEDDQ